jgi:CRISPR-associated protein Cas1
MESLQLVPRFDDSLTYVYAEHARVDRWQGSLGLWDERGVAELPVAAIRCLMLGPGSSVTHAAIDVLAEMNCLVVWCGEEMVRFYAHGMGGTRSAGRLLHQVRQWSEEAAHMRVVRRMYAKRFAEIPPAEVTLQQLRGMEGQRVRETYRRLSEETGVPWTARSYDRGRWGKADPINRAVSAATSCLYGICHAATLSAGYSAALGFIHTGKQLSFVYDVADLYKTEVSLPTAFRVTGAAPPELEREVRRAMRDAFRSAKLVDRIIPDLRDLLEDGTTQEDLEQYDDDEARPAELWEPLAGGKGEA